MKPELFLQTQFAHWLDQKGLLYCASAGGMRVNMVTAINMKRAGYRKGFPDIFIYEPCGKYYGLAIEIKAGTNIRVTPEQRNWQEELNKRGYLALIMPRNLDFTDALQWLQEKVETYLKGNN